MVFQCYSKSESLLLEVANLLTRGRELGIQDDGLTSALGDANQIAAANAEIIVITEHSCIAQTKFNGKLLETGDFAIGVNDESTTHAAGPNKNITAVDDMDATASSSS